MRSTAYDRFSAWCAREEDGQQLLAFRRAFALLWLLYDLLDVTAGGTASTLWWVTDGRPWLLAGLQVSLIGAQGALAWGFRPCAMALLCIALRGAEALWILPLNDFYYYCVVMLMLSQAAARPGGRTLVWVRDTLLLQAAWIYFATGLLKLNPAWLGGGHLFVRIQYMAEAYTWPYPEAFRAWTATLSHDALLAWAGVAGELTLAALLALRAPRRVVLAIAIAIHGFAALAVNVWFFGAAMVLHVGLARARR